MRYAQLRAFDSVARLNSFSRAADHLAITQPAVTLQVKALEDEYDIQLFHRHGGGVTLTSAGKSMFELTRKMFDVEEDIRHFLSDRQALEAGELILGADGPHVALDVISQLGSFYPGIKVRLELGNASQIWRDLNEHRIDAAIMANPSNDKRVDIHPILKSDMMLIIQKDHPCSVQQRISLQDLLDLPMIVREVGSNTRRCLEESFRSAGLEFKPTMELGSREAVREAVALGMGAGVVFTRETVGDERVVSIPIAEMKETNLDTLTILSKNRHRKIIQALVQCVEDMTKL